MQSNMTDFDCQRIAEKLAKLLKEQNTIGSNEEYSSLEQVMKEYHVSKRTLYRHIKNGSLPAEKRFNRFFIKKTDLKLLILRRSA